MNHDDLIKQRITHDRKNADQGDFFFANIVLSDGEVHPHPVFVIGKNEDSNDSEDVLVCACTKADNGKRSDYDIVVQLKMKTIVRTNKIYTMQKNQLKFKIPQRADDRLEELISSAVEAINLK